jgi:cellulose synthase (UDP-forming)
MYAIAADFIIMPINETYRSTSVSEQMRVRFDRRKQWRHLVALIYMILMIVYLGWRYTIIDANSLALSIAFYLAECIAFILCLKSILGTWSYHHRNPLPASPDLSVDVLLPVYTEPVEIIRRTVMAARAIRYPHRTVMLDDGKRDELKALASELGIDYLRRPDNQGAKAGNLNFGLKHSESDYVLVFDADHIALPHALDIMLGFFTNPKVAMVQTPQDYYNTDAIQYVNSRNGALWHDQSTFYNLLQPCADGVNAAECVGTGVVYRRSALDQIGGIPPDTVTEDTHTSLRFHKAGLETVYLNEPVAYGLAAADLAEYYKTRHRWGHGNLDVLCKERVLTSKGLTLAQRIHYGLMGLNYLEGWQQLLLLLLPIFTLVLGMPAFEITFLNVALISIFPLVSYMFMQELGCGFARYWANEIFSMMRWPVYIAASFGIFGGKMRFRSSLKTAAGKVNWWLMMPQISILVLSIFSIGYGYLILVETGFQKGLMAIWIAEILNGRLSNAAIWSEQIPQGMTVDLYCMAGLWAVYGIARVAFFLRKTLRCAANSHDFFRFKVPIPVRLEDETYACVTQLAEDWVQFRCDQIIKQGSQLTFTAFLPAGPLSLTMEVTESHGGLCSGPLHWTSTEARDQLAASLYSVDWHREFLHRNAEFLVPSDLLLGLMRPRPARMRYYAILLEDKRTSSSCYCILMEPDRSDASASLIAFVPLAQDYSYESMVFRSERIVRTRIVIESKEDLQSLVSKGLDGASPCRYRVKMHSID